MKIAILGTRGIPNNYGGFEQCAEHLSVGLVQNGYDVTVYSVDSHPYNKDQFKKVNMDYSINTSIYQGLSNPFVKMRLRATTNPNKMINVSYDSRYRALHDQLVLIDDEVNKKKGIYKELTGINPENDAVDVSRKDKDLLNKANKAGWSRDGADLKLSTVFELIQDFEKNNAIFSQLKVAGKLSESRKARIFSQLDARGYQYN